MKDIKGFEGLYAITSCGKVWSYYSNKFLVATLDKNEYKKITLHKEGKVKTFFIHRLVREAYIPNPTGLPQVNHKNEVKTDNYINNLEWCDAAYNNNYGTRTKKVVEKLKKPIYCVELDRVFDSLTQAANELGLDQGSITKCCQGKRTYCGGYHWRYAEVI